MEEENNRIIDPKQESDDGSLDLTLRSQRFADYIGQDKVKTSLEITIQAAKGRKESIEHVLLYGALGS